MKKNLMHFVVLLCLVIGNLGAVQTPTQPQKKSIVGRIRAERSVWQQGIAAAKKRHIQKQSLNRQEAQAYRAVLKWLGGLTALLAVIGIGVGVGKQQQKKAALKDDEEYVQFKLRQAREEAATLERERAEIAASKTPEAILEAMLSMVSLGRALRRDTSDSEKSIRNLLRKGVTPSEDQRRELEELGIIVPTGRSIKPAGTR